MAIDTANSTAQFLELFKPIEAKEPDAFKRHRARAWDRFLEMGLPHAGVDAYQYMRLKPLFMQKFVRPSPKKAYTREQVLEKVAPECIHSYFVFVDGHFSEALSDSTALAQSVVRMPLSQAMKSYGTLVNNSWTKALKEEEDPFVCLNMACSQDGLFLYVPPKIEIESPVQIIHILTDGGVWVMPRVHIFQGAHSKLTLLATTMSDGISSQKSFCNTYTEVAVEEGAMMTLILQGSVASGWQFDALRMTLKRASSCKVYKLSDGKAVLRRDSKIELAGEGSEANISGTWLLDGDKETHVHVFVDHQEPHTHSMQLFKGVLTDGAHSSFQGKIMVRKKAQKTEAYQLNNNLLLSEKAQANSKPNLEVFADDVKASHGATIGQLDPEELFYLKSRGFSEEDAKACLIAGFCREVIGQLPIASLRNTAEKSLAQYHKL